MANISGHGVPAKNTVGILGDIYTDLNTGTKYECILAYKCTGYGEDNSEYIWDRIFRNSSVDSSEENEWKHLKTVVGQEEIILPENCKEIFCLVTPVPTDEMPTVIPFSIPYISLKDSFRAISLGVPSRHNYVGATYVQIRMSKSNLYLAYCACSDHLESWTAVTDTAEVCVYYR